MTKAYDRVDWHYLEQVMRQLGFHTLWIGWVMECVKTVSFSITVNGEAGESFHPSRGIRQGCPLSPYLFLLCGEGFTALCIDHVSKKLLYGFRINRHCPVVSHLLFADDSVVYYQAMERDCAALYNIMELYEADLLMNQISAEIAKFWWGSKEAERKIHWIKWDKLSRCKGKGGLGFRDLDVFNRALIAKQGWKLISGEPSLFKRIFKGKYFPNTTFFNANVSSQASWALRSICWARELLNKGWRWQVCSGKDIRIWEDHWLPKPPAFKVSPSSVISSTITYVSDLIDNSTKTWKMQLIKESFNEEETTVILSLPISTTQRRDRKVWHYSPNGVFTVKSAYCLEKESLINELDNHGAQTSSANVMALIWKKLWGLPILPKIKFFAWKCFNEALATNSALTAKKKRPEEGMIKINVDAAVSKATSTIGTGAIARNANGSILEIFNKSYEGLTSPRLAEAMAIRNGLNLGVALNVGRVLIESDAESIVRSCSMSKIHPLILQFWYKIV
ncbi:uncharacterized protein LOC131313998 [Rhododendron vialii]|uniref:uncharacterized protein LOC131313998 n=1 Tax=Rhododendron vialii TaxID=182163 RepID=UPI00265FCA0D|nr:uncharacterized protein LOC131313998 [Rhododendron vialii]